MAISTTTTIEIEIKKIKPHDGKGWEWSIEPKDEKANKGRYKDEEGAFKGKWNKRNPKKPPPDSEKDHHFPIVFELGKTLNFTCPDGFEFAIGAKKNADVDEFPGAPDNPFGWPPNSKPVEVAAGTSLSALVKPNANGPGPKEQAFYKFHGWVRLADGTKIPIDPDGYCGG
jgi:hypothetical protein